MSDYQVLVEYCMSGTGSQRQRKEPTVVIETAGWKVQDRSKKVTRERVTMSKMVEKITVLKETIGKRQDISHIVETTARL